MGTKWSPKRKAHYRRIMAARRALQGPGDSRKVAATYRHGFNVAADTLRQRLQGMAVDAFLKGESQAAEALRRAAKIADEMSIGDSGVLP